jgi:hypothetical protein
MVTEVADFGRPVRCGVELFSMEKLTAARSIKSSVACGKLLLVRGSRFGEIRVTARP